MTTLLITLAPADSTDPALHDYVLSQDGHTVDAHTQGPLDQCPGTGQTALEVVAVVPAQALSWHRVQLPAGTLARGWMAERSAPRLRAVLEGLLEDQLLDEPAQLHFALQPGARDGAPVWVAVCQRAWLQAALQTLQQAGHTPHRVVPEWAPDTTAASEAPAAPRWVTGSADRAHLVWADALGVHRWPLSSHSPVPVPVPADAPVLAEPAVAQLAEQLLHRSAPVRTPAQRLLDAAQTDWDLAQGALARRNPWLARLTVAAATLWSAPQWRAARWAALGLVAVQLAGLNAFAWHAQAQLQQQRSAIRHTLATSFPDITVVVDAPLQMQRALATLQQRSGAASSTDLETLLQMYGAFGPPALVNTAPNAIDFVAGELRLRGPDPQQAQALHSAVQAHGLAAHAEGDTLVLRHRSPP